VLTLVFTAILAVGALHVSAETKPAITAQVVGNVAYAETKHKREPHEIALGTVSPDETSVFVDAHVLFNARADQHVAVFGASHEGRTVQECNQKLDAQINDFTNQVKAIGIKGEEIVVDFIAQNRIYDYEVAGNLANEKLTGFEVKKNILIPYKERDVLDKLLIAAAKSSIFDLIKVDYVVTDVSAIRAKLLEEGARIVKEKAERYGKLFNIKFRSQVQVYAAKYDTAFPTESYDSYTAFETGKVTASNYNERYKVKEARKSKTFYFNPRDAGDFDYVINPVVTEPVVQFSLHLRVKHSVDR
jgi:uncharacterized protein YggE